MWIQEIVIEHFGALSRIRVSDLKPGLTVIVGRNEAGKTTLMEFVQSVFFGFRKRNYRGNPYEAMNSNFRSGFLVVNDPQAGVLRISRNEKHGLKEGELSITDRNGAHVDPFMVPFSPSGFRKYGYENLFAFDLDQMRQLDREALRSRIITAALGSPRINPLSILEKLNERSRALWKKPTGGRDSLWKNQSRVGEINIRLRHLQERPAECATLNRELEEAGQRRQELAEVIRCAESQMSELEDVLRFESDWEQLVSLERKRAEVEAAQRFPIDGIPRYESALQKYEEADQERSEGEAQLQHLERQLEAIAIDSNILEHADKILALSRKAATLANVPDEIDQGLLLAERSRARRAQEINGLGHGWDAERIRGLKLPLSLEQEIQSFVDTYQDQRERIRDFENRIASTQDISESLEEKISAKKSELQLLLGESAGYLTQKDRAKLYQCKNYFQKMSELAHRSQDEQRVLDALIQEKIELSQNLQGLELQNPRSISTPVFWMIAVATLAISGGILLSSIMNGSGWMHGFAGTAALLIAPMLFAWRMKEERARNMRIQNQRELLIRKSHFVTSRLTDTEKRRRTYLQEIDSIKRRIRDTAREVLDTPSVSLEEIERAEQRSIASESAFLRSQFLKTSLGNDLAELEIQNTSRAKLEALLSEELQELTKHDENWKIFIAECGLGPELSAEIAIDFVRNLRKIGEANEQAHRESEDLERIQTRWQAFLQEILDLANLMGRHVNEDPLQTLALWESEERSVRELLLQKKGWEEKAQDLRTRMDVLNSRIAHSRQTMERLFAAAGVADEEAFRKQHLHFEQFVKISGQLDTITDRLTKSMKFADREAMHSFYSVLDFSSRKKQAAHLRGEIDNARMESEALLERIGSIGARIAALEAENETDVLLAEKQELSARIHEDVKALITTRIAHTLLERSLRVYELEKQPKMLERASEILRSITGNKFQRVIMPLEGTKMKVERENGTWIDEEFLSRGTLEQLYLALRLSDLELYRSDKYVLPLIMDDVLVNFDFFRAGLTAMELAKFSEDSGIQVLFFTCHPSVAALFPERVAQKSLDKKLE
ncbi:AAA family ATPase [Desulfomonile tiedjei]|uniref:YhaN AAA domain-containing protein n=1 Tax=Desulfomonile tiedjei (strain ATCC 49306 / DSM 6799 / DCB-1) TaxID=706587 RepID=I4C662_DESTA|nr:AAA family ATPase [Desulfomonile tiedjei]AFM25053.1 hypothetical protein Desti_2368 [Desulfomonile tiedjei DSM 6799]